MSLKPIFIGCCCFLPLLLGCAADNAMDSSNSSNSMLVIGAQLNAMNPVGNVYNRRYVVSAVSVKNLASGQVYNMALDSGHAVAEIPAGSYCLNSLRPENSSPLVYCGKPFFTLVPHKIVVAGYFVFAIDYSDHNYTLSNALIDKQALFNQLSKTELKSLENFDGEKE